MDTVSFNCEVRTIFSNLTIPLPSEIVTTILDLAEKWHLTLSLALPRSSNLLKIPQTSESGQKSCEDRVLLISPPFTPRDVSQLRKVSFTIISRDQGWSTYPTDWGTYNNSWTWFDALVLPAEDQNPAEDTKLQTLGQYQYYGSEPVSRHLQHNRHAGQSLESYRIELRRAEWVEAFGDIHEGDRVALTARARFPGWVNQVQDAGMEIWSADVGD